MQNNHNMVCEEIVYKMAIAFQEARVSQILRFLNELCPECKQKLTKLLTAEF